VQLQHHLKRLFNYLFHHYEMICHYFKFFNITLKEKKNKKNPRVHQNFQNPANLLQILYFKVEKTSNLIKKKTSFESCKKIGLYLCKKRHHCLVERTLLKAAFLGQIDAYQKVCLGQIDAYQKHGLGGTHRRIVNIPAPSSKMRISPMSLNAPQIWVIHVYRNSKRSRRVRLLAGSLLDNYVKLRSTMALFENPLPLSQFFPHFFPLSRAHSTGLARKNLDIFCPLKEKLDAQVNGQKMFKFFLARSVEWAERGKKKGRKNWRREKEVIKQGHSVVSSFNFQEHP
jgi:hypothetical protein